MLNTIICTVGTSLLANLKNLKPENAMEFELKSAFIQSEPDKIAEALLWFSPEERICGAEINTIASLKKMHRYKDLDLKNFRFLLSDTKDGEITGAILQNYFVRAWEKLGLNQEPTCVCRRVVNLQDERPWDFRHYGLRNLVKEISAAVREAGSLDACVIDATGGYKAQIAIAVMFGQMTGVPVFYKHERFNEIIDFPPLPVNFDFSLYEEYFDLLYRLCIGNEVFDEISLPGYFGASSVDGMTESPAFQRFRVFLDECSETSAHQKKAMYDASAVAYIYFEAAQQRMDNHIRHHIHDYLPACSDAERKEPHLTDDHFPDGFERYVRSVYTKYAWIKGIHTIPYDKQKGIRNTGFYLQTINNEKQLIGTYVDGNNFGARFRILLKDNSVTALHAALWLLTENK